MNVAIVEALPPALKNTLFVEAGTDQMLRDDDLVVSCSDTCKYISLKVLRRSGDLFPFEDLAHKLVIAADQLDEDYMVIYSFSSTVETFNLGCLYRVIKGLLKGDTKRLKATFIVLRPGFLDSESIYSLGFRLRAFYLYRPSFSPEVLEYFKMRLDPSDLMFHSSYRSEEREVGGYISKVTVWDAIWVRTPFAPCSKNMRLKI